MLILGHRGASAAAPENTPTAFALADQMGADGIELDVRWVPDGRLVVAHDPLPEAIAEIDACGYSSFAEVLDACGERMVLNVEIKNWHADTHFDPTAKIVEPIIDELRRRGPAFVERCLISSFSFRTITACRTYAPEIRTAWLVTVLDTEVIARAAAGGHAAVHPWEPTVTVDAVGECHAAGLLVNAWTCNDPDRLVELERFGVDGVCTDVPDVAVRALGRSLVVTPQWPAAVR